MEACKLEMVAESVHVATGSTKKCVCGATLELIRSMLDSETGRVIHMYECKCGNRTWNEEFFDVTALKARARVDRPFMDSDACRFDCGLASCNWLDRLFSDQPTVLKK
jgi:hypothetical protein